MISYDQCWIKGLIFQVFNKMRKKLKVKDGKIVFYFENNKYHDVFDSEMYSM